MRWGYAMPWYGEFLQYDTEPLFARLKFLLAHDLHVTSIGLQQVLSMSEQERERLSAFLHQNDLQLCPLIGFNYLTATPDEAREQTEYIIEGLRQHSSWMRGSIVHTAAHAGHRFDRQLPVEAKLERLGTVLAPLAEACAELGMPLGIENHGDFYCTEFVELCKQTPHLYMFLDTGNTYLIGERPLPAFELAAPYTVGSHFKDHRVAPRPQARPLHFEVAGSVLGEGDVPLRECYALLKQHAPWPDKLVLEIEMIAPDDVSPTECLDRSLRFIRSL